MIAKLCLHDLRNLVGIGKVEGSVGKSWVEQTTPRVAQFATLACRTLVLGVEAGQRGKGSLLLCHALGELAQLILHPVDFLLFDDGVLRQDLHLHGCGNLGQTVRGHVLEIGAHLCRAHLDVLHQFLLLLLYQLSVAEVVVHVLPHL